MGRGSPQCFPAASRPIGVEAFYHAVILTVQTSYCKKWHRECPEKRRTPRALENGAAVSARVPAGVSLEYGETFPGGNPGPAECRRSRPRGLPGYPYRLLKCCGRLHTPSRTGRRVSFWPPFSNGASYLQPSIGKNGYGFQPKDHQRRAERLSVSYTHLTLPTT